jgi:hypothetical protein
MEAKCSSESAIDFQRTTLCSMREGKKYAMFVFYFILFYFIFIFIIIIVIIIIVF